MARIVDLKKLGVIQDLKELKKDKDKTKLEVRRIREEGKSNIKRYEAKIKDSARLERKLSQISSQKQNTINQLKGENNDYRRNKVQGALSHIKSNIRKEKLKQIGYQAAKVGSKIESRVSVGLENISGMVGKLSNQRVISRQIVKPNKMVVVQSNRPVESAWDEPNRFFKGTFEQEKRSMFFR